MRREISVLVAHIMDTFLPPFIRDSKWLMWPFFRHWFAGSQDIASIMEFKRLAFKMTDAEFRGFYERLRCRSARRNCDTCTASLNWAKERVPSDCATLLDVGCGGGIGSARWASYLCAFSAAIL